MTKVALYSIKCECGNTVGVTLYESVNVTVSPDLISKVKNREINNYYCSKCGVINELAFKFLYVNMKEKQSIWCYPEKMKFNQEKIQKELGISPANKLLEKFGGGKTAIVFGYDGLFARIGIEGINVNKRTSNIVREFFGKACKLKKEGNLQEAMKNYSRALDILVKESSKYAHEFESVSVDEGSTRKILPKYFKKSREYLKESKIACIISNNMGTILAELGDIEGARTMFKEAIELTPDGINYKDPHIGLEELE